MNLKPKDKTIYLDMFLNEINRCGCIIMSPETK